MLSFLPGKVSSACLAVLLLLIASDRAQAATVIWDGGGADVKWNTVLNWSTDALPLNTDIVQFGSGFASGTAINLNGNRTVDSVIINTITGFSIINNTLTLTTGNITRNDVAGTEADQTISSAITLGANGTWTVNGSGSLIVSGNVGGAFALTKAGAGTLVLSGGNGYTGATSINAGVVNAQDKNAFGTTAGGVTVASGAAVQLQGTIAVGTEALTLNGSGIASTGALRNISDINSWSGAVTLGSASTIASDAGTLTLSGAFNNGGFLATLTGAGNTTASGIISGTGGLTKTGAGTLTLSGVNTFAGLSTIDAGTVAINNAASLGANAAATINAGTLQVTATFTGTRNFTLGSASSTILVDSGRTYTASGVFSSSGRLNKAGAGTLILGGTNTYSGGTTIDGGTVAISSNANLGNTGGAVTINAGTLQVTAGFTSTRALTLGNAASTILVDPAQNYIVNSAIAGSGALNKAGTGTLTLGGTSANTYGGDTLVNDGTLILNKTAGVNAVPGNLSVGDGGNTVVVQLGASNQIPDSSVLSVFKNGTFDLNGFSETIASLSMSAGTITNTSGTLTLGGDVTTLANGTVASITGGTFNMGGGTRTFTIADGGAKPDLVISGIVINGNIVKEGLGTLELSGTSNSFGTSTVNAGELRFDGLGGAAAGSVHVNSAGVIGVGADFDPTSLITASSSGLLSISTNAFTQNLNQNTIGNGLMFIGAVVNGSITGGSLVANTSDNTYRIGGGANTLSIKTDNYLTGANNVIIGGKVTYNNVQNNSGLTTITNGGLLKAQTDNVLSASSAVAIESGSILDNNGRLNTIAGLSGVGSLKTGGGTVTINNSANYTFDGVISENSGILIKTGTGTQTLTGANTYTGATTVSAGVLNIQNATALGTVAAGTTVGSGGTLQLQGGITVGAETLNINGNGASGQTGALVNVSGTNNYGGLLTLAGAATISSDSGTLNLTNVGTITGATFGLSLDGAGNGTVSGIIGTTTGTLTKSGAGTWTLTGANTYTGLTTVSAGTLAYGASNVISTGAVTVNGATAILDLGANRTDTVGTVTVAGGGSITGSGTSALTSTGTFEMQSGSVSAILAGTGIALNKTTAGTATLSGANTYTGATTITSGVLSVGSLANGGSASNIGASTNAAANLVFDGGTLQYTGATAGTDRNFTINTGKTATIDVTTNTLTMAGASTATNGALTKTGAGTLTMAGASANTFTGNTTVSGGTLAANADGALGSTAKITINVGGTVLMGTTAGNNRISNTAEVDLAGGTFNTGGFTETVGKMTLSGNSTFDFGAGTSLVTFDGNSSLGSSTLTVLNWTGVQWNSGGTDQLLFKNSSFTAGSTTSQVQFNIGGTLYNSIFLDVGSSTLELVPVPEPATIFGASALLVGIAWRERKRFTRLLQRI